MSNYGIKISRDGIDARTADDRDLCYSSDFRTFKIYKIVKFTSTGSQEHGLNYSPMFIVPIQLDVDFDYSQGARGFGNVFVDNKFVYCNDLMGQSEYYIILCTDSLNE
jgi:hypothetical protein